MTKVTPEAIVKCKANGNMEYPFVGRVKKCYENSALVRILEYADADAMNARELLYLAVISKKQMKVMKAGVAEPSNENAAEAG